VTLGYFLAKHHFRWSDLQVVGEMAGTYLGKGDGCVERGIEGISSPDPWGRASTLPLPEVNNGLHGSLLDLYVQKILKQHSRISRRVPLETKQSCLIPYVTGCKHLFTRFSTKIG